MFSKNDYMNYESDSQIIDMKKYNGRVNIMEVQDPDAKFKMYEKIAIKNKATEYRDPLLGIWEKNVLAQVFFSSENEQIIQNGIRSGVYNMSNKKYVVAQQNSDQLKIVMRSIYLQNAKHQVNNITRQVEELNDLVLDYCISFVYSEAVSYVKYLEDQSTLVVPLERAKQSDRDFKQLQEKPWS
jgi:hypothetical protein